MDPKVPMSDTSEAAAGVAASRRKSAIECRVMKPVAIFRHARSEGPAYFATYLERRAIPWKLFALDEGRAEFVLGSRILGGATLSALLPQAWFGNRLACFLMRVLFGARYTDLGPFRAIRVRAFKRLQMADTGFGWTIEMQLKAHSAGLRVSEVPVRYRPRVGKSKITGTVRGTLRAGAKILGWIGAWRVRTWFRS